MISIKATPNLKIITGLAGSNLLGMGIGIIGGLVQSYYVSPEDLGYFKSFTIATGYAFVLNLGLFGAVQRLYPYYIGKGEKNKAIAVAEIAQSWNILVTSVLSVVFVTLAVLKLQNGNWKGSLGWFAQAVAMAGFIYGGYLNATFRSGQEFKTISKATIISSSASLLVLPFFTIIPYITLAIRSMFGPLLNLVYLHLKRPLKVKWRFNYREFLELMKIGFPIFISGYGATTFWSVVETSIILKFYGPLSLGLWTISFMVSEAAIKIPQAITQVYSPKIMETFGKNNKIGPVLALIKKPLTFGVPIMLFVSFLACLSLKLLVPVIMPKYIAALPIMYLFMLLIPLTLLEMPFQIIIAKGRGMDQNISVFAGLVIFIILAFIFNSLGLGLAGVVAASLLGRLLSRLITYYYVFRYKKLEKQIII
jgi:O-antigen/teichoic acid export membrane protein